LHLRTAKAASSMQTLSIDLLSLDRFRYVLCLTQENRPINIYLPPEIAISAPGIVFALGIIVLEIVVSIVFAVAVAVDCGHLAERRGRPVFVGTAIWFLATLLGGPFVAGLYWVMHHSTICPFVYAACRQDTA